MWNYGSLNDEQEADYIKAKMIMVNKDFDKFVENCIYITIQRNYLQVAKYSI